jgi:ubiquitin-like modifier-activating enzyme ATG7
MPILQFAPFSSVVSPAFWHKLTDLKIDVLKLSDAAIPVTGTYTPGRSILDRETGTDVVLPVSFSVDGESFQQASGVASGSVVGEVGNTGHRAVKVEGTFKNFNTIEEFKSADKNALLNAEADKVRRSLPSPPVVA